MKKRLLAGLLGVIAFGAPAFAADSCAGARDLKLVNGKIVTMDKGNTVASEVTIQNGECEEADRPDVRQARVGGCGAELAGTGKRTAAEWMDEETDVVPLRRPLREKDAAAAAEKERKVSKQLSLDLPEATYQECVKMCRVCFMTSLARP